MIKHIDPLGISFNISHNVRDSINEKQRDSKMVSTITTPYEMNYFRSIYDLFLEPNGLFKGIVL